MSKLDGFSIPNFLDFNMLKPGISLSIVENLIGDLTIWKTINLELHIHQDKTLSAGVITAQSDQLDESSQEKKLVLLPKGKNGEYLEPDAFPFSNGSYLVIDQPSLWNTPVRDIKIRSNLLVCPLVHGKSSLIRTLNRNTRFEVMIQGHLLTLRFWTNDREHPFNIENANAYSIKAENSKWEITSYTPNQIVRFKEQNLDKIVVAFDESLVEQAILIRRQRGYENVPSEFYILALKKN